MQRMAIICLVLFSASAAMAQVDQADRDAETLYRIVSSRPVAERRVVFRNVTPETKAAVWRVHVRHFLDSHPALSEAQRKVLVQFLTLINADLYRTLPDDPEWEAQVALPFARMQDSAAAILTPDQYREALTVLGPLPDPALPSALPITSGLLLSRAHLGAIEADYCVGCYVPDCECNLGDNWCLWGQTCFGDNCKSDSWGCGTVWQKVCNGMCR